MRSVEATPPQAQDSVAVLIDWENIFYTLNRQYGVTIPATTSLPAILRKAREYGQFVSVVVFYGQHLQDEDETLGHAIRYCGADPYPIAGPSLQGRGESEKNLADTYLVAEAIDLLHVEKPRTIIIVSGDKGYTPALKKIRERRGQAVVFALKKSVAGLLKESEFIRDAIVDLDDLILQAQQPSRQPLTPMSSIVRPERAVIADTTSLDIRRLLLRMEACLLEKGYPAISRGELMRLVGVTSNSEGDVWGTLIDDAVKDGRLEVEERRMRDNTLKPHYRPNPHDELVRDTLLAWITLVGTIRREQNVRGRAAPLVNVLNQLAPPSVNPETGERILGENPERDLLRTLHAIGVEIGALQMTTESNEEGRSVTMVALVQDHPLVQSKIELNVSVKELPGQLQEQLAALEAAVRELCEEYRSPEVTASGLWKRLPPTFPKKVLMVAEALGVVACQSATGRNTGRPVTLVSIPAR